ncbi:hypothetical protein CYY_000902 [Polysphondylium violaceum]|uniref:RNA helicase n=1 Tax=Polysphondylium violaceum TaxID=133409 RepID=A0A8J4Q0Y3_9MYCE|nr:hypothetical protein CYY_000902 [Polysphondylium violaceum]
MDNSIFFSLGNGATFNKKKYAKEINIFKGVNSSQLEKKPQSTAHFFGKPTVQQQKVSKPAPAVAKKEQEKEKEEKKEDKKEEKKKQDKEDDDQDSSSDNSDKEEQDNEEEDYIEEDDDQDEVEGKNSKVSIFSHSKTKGIIEEEEEEEQESKKKRKETPEEKHKREMATLRQKNKIKVEGTDIPDPFTDFSQLGERFKMRQYLLKNIAEAGYKEPSPIQMQTIPTLLKQREVLGIAQTGSGKTAAFSIPILQTLKEPKKEGFRAVIIAPTRELAQQIYRNFKLFSKGKPFRICVLSKNLNSTNEPMSKNFDILITTPLRLVYLIKEGNVALNRVEYLIFDEADKLFDKDFLEQVDSVVDACKNDKLKKCLFSATINTAVEDLAKSIMDNPVKITIGEQNSAATTVDQKLIYVGGEEGKLLAIRQLFQKGLEPPILIFTQSKERAHDLFQELIFDGINVDVIHSDRTQFQRDTIVKKFRTGQIWVLICTELMARGMDFKGVNYVINFDFPQTLASYVHRIGRTGRAGREGTAYTLYTEADAPMLPTIAHAMRQSGSDVPEWMNHLKSSNQEKYNYKKKGVDRDSFSTIPLSERQSTKFKPKKKTLTYNMPGAEATTNTSDKKSQEKGKVLVNNTKENGKKNFKKNNANKGNNNKVKKTK